MGDNGHLSTTDASRLMGCHPDTIGVHIKLGYMRARRNENGGKTSHAYRIQWPDLVDYWREHHEGRCMRCTITEEATPERGFLCGPCEYEVRTGRIWWPRLPRQTVASIPAGKLLLGGNFEPHNPL